MCAGAQTSSSLMAKLETAETTFSARSPNSCSTRVHLSGQGVTSFGQSQLGFALTHVRNHAHKLKRLGELILKLHTAAACCQQLYFVVEGESSRPRVGCEGQNSFLASCSDDVLMHFCDDVCRMSLMKRTESSSLTTANRLRTRIWDNMPQHNWKQRKTKTKKTKNPSVGD